MSAPATSDGPWLGIDFSGDRTRWGAGVGRPTVWVSRLVRSRARLVVEDLRPVQALPGRGSPFDRLAQWLAAGAYRAAAIDAPCSLPAAYVPDGGHPALLARVGALDRDGADFPRARALLCSVGAPDAVDHADALDAVVCALGAVAVTDGRLPEEDERALATRPEVALEGWIAVHAPPDVFSRSAPPRSSRPVSPRRS